MKKRLLGALYGIFLESLLDKMCNWKAKVEKEYFNYCRIGCENCYMWKGYCRSENSGTPYKKFRKKKYSDKGEIKRKHLLEKVKGGKT